MSPPPDDDSITRPQASRPAWRGRRSLRLFGWVLFVPVCLTMLGLDAVVLYARTGSGRERIRRLAVAQARKSVPGLSIGFVGGDYVHDLWLRDVEVRDDQGRVAVHVDRLAVRHRLWSLIHRTLLVDELDADGVRVSAHPDPRGGLNLAHLTPPSPASPPAHPAGEPARPSAWKIRVERIRVAVVEASVESEDGATATIHDATLDGALALEGERVRARIAGLSAAADRDDEAYALSLSNLSLDLDRHSVKFAVQALRLTGLLRGERAARSSGQRRRSARSDRPGARHHQRRGARPFPRRRGDHRGSRGSARLSGPTISS